MKLGDTAYKDEARFPTGPWCKEGDFVITRAYSGTRIKIFGNEFRIINDDTVEAVLAVPGPAHVVVRMTNLEPGKVGWLIQRNRNSK